MAGRDQDQSNLRLTTTPSYASGRTAYPWSSSVPSGPLAAEGPRLTGPRATAGTGAAHGFVANGPSAVGQHHYKGYSSGSAYDSNHLTGKFDPYTGSSRGRPLLAGTGGAAWQSKSYDASPTGFHGGSDYYRKVGLAEVSTRSKRLVGSRKVFPIKLEIKSIK